SYANRGLWQQRGTDGTAPNVQIDTIDTSSESVSLKYDGSGLDGVNSWLQGASTKGVSNGTRTTDVDMLSLHARIAADGNEVTFSTAEEHNLFGFEIWRSDTASGNYYRINRQIIPAQSLSGAH